MNTTLQKNIDRYMDLKGMSYYTDLLIAIAKVQGMKQDDAIAYAYKEKSNFSKMLKGERSLKYDYIIPLEKIFGVPLAKLLDEQPYQEEVNKENIPFLKSFRYYAYKDEPALYDELDKTHTSDGSSVLGNSDEFNRYFLDYLIEYRAFNGLRFLVEKHRFKLNRINARLYEIDNSAFVSSSLPIQTAKFVIDSNDSELFNKIYDPFEYLMRFSYREADCLYTDEVFIEAVLNNENIFESLFTQRTYAFDFINPGVTPNDGNKPDINCINPLLNVCLDYCLNNVDKYKEQAIKILEFGQKYNKKTLDGLAIPQNEFHVDVFGNLYVGWRCYYANLIYTDAEGSGDTDINSLIVSLPALKKGN